jgi:hypothetical protein
MLRSHKRKRKPPVEKSETAEEGRYFGLKLAATVIVVSFFTGFLVGLGEHRDGKEVAEFVSDHTSSELTGGSPMLVFQCGSNEKLVAYDLLNDEVLVKRDAIEARLHNPLLQFTRNELFGGAAGFALTSLGAAYSFDDEVKLIAAGKSSFRRVALILIVAIPTIYLGYEASDYFKLECASEKLYRYLYKAENWRPHQFFALRQLYQTMEPCVPRRVSFRGYVPEGANIGGHPFEPEHKELDAWLEVISGSPEGLKPIDGPTGEEKAALLHKLSGRDAVNIDISNALWGDSIYFRLFGTNGYTSVDAKIDGADFRALLQQSRGCQKRAEELGSRFKSGSGAEFIDFEYRRAEEEQSVVRSQLLDDDSFGRRWLRLAESAQSLK